MRYFFSGICGISMSSIAIYIKMKGHDVVGSDAHPNEEIKTELENHGINVIPFQGAENVYGDIFVYTAAVDANNPEILRAREIGMKILSRAELLSRICDGFETSIGISGTHGKSTVSGMCEKIFVDCGCDPTAFIGAKNAEGLSMLIGGGSKVIYEACEYKRSFLNFHPSIGVILNIERDHTDCYPSIELETDAFSDFAQNSNKVILNLDDKNISKISHPKAFFFSLDNKKADLYADNIRMKNGFWRYTGVLNGRREFEISLSVPGIHNLKNSLAAMSVSAVCGLDLSIAARSLSEFRGMKRRFEFIGNFGGAVIFDDYAHHPTEIRATLRVAREMGFKRIVCAFQSHTFSRTAAFFNEFASSFFDADRVLITNIFAARETDMLGVSGKILAEATPNAEYVPFELLAERLAELALPETAIITLGAGELDRVARELV